MVGLVDVPVPAHRRGQHQVTGMHHAAPAVDDGDGALGAGRETDRRGGMPVRHRMVARFQDGEGADHVAGRGGFAAEGRVHADDGAALHVLDRHFLRGAIRQRFEVTPFPLHGRVLHPWLYRRDALVAVPQRVVARRLEGGDQGRVGTRRVRCVHRHPPWVRPPSTASSCPVTNRAASELRKATGPAIASGSSSSGTHCMPRIIFL